jgi:hypothetical protein
VRFLIAIFLIFLVGWLSLVGQDVFYIRNHLPECTSQ